jgi:hypothetical protein
MEPSQAAWLRTPMTGTLPSCQSPSIKVQVFDQPVLVGIRNSNAS